MLTDLVFRLRALFLRRAVDRELDDELRLHLELQTEKYMRAGAAPAEAERRARIELGGVEQVKERTRDSWGTQALESTVQDLGYAFRVLRKSPVFTGAVVLSLGLGIGANTAIFTLMDAVMWRSLPVADPHALLVVGQQRQHDVELGFSYAEYRLMRDSDAEVDVAGYAMAPINISVDGPTEPSVQGHLVSGDYFTVLGVRPVLGRVIGPDDDRLPNGHQIVMLSHGYWERRFARDPLVIGRPVRLSGVPFTIVGVTPPGFFGVEVGAAPDLFLPLMMQPTVMPAFENLLENPMVNRPWVQVVARLRPGLTSAQAASVFDAIIHSERNRRQPAGTVGSRRPIVLAPAISVSSLRRQFSRPLIVLLTMVALVLLIACANTANLLLARAAARRREFAMRLALGATRQRVIRQLLIESLLLAACGGVFGVLLAGWVTHLLVVYISIGRTPIVLDLTPNFRILAFTMIVSVLTGVVFGLAPARRATGVALADALSAVRTRLTTSLHTDRILSIVQIAVSLLLLCGAGLFVRSLENLDGGEDSARRSVVMLRVEPRGSDQRGIPGTSERLHRLYQELIRRTDDIPGVQLASMAQVTPTAPSPNSSPFVDFASGERVRVPAAMVYPGYFATIDIPVIMGRDFGQGDLADTAPSVCVVNESFARAVYPAVDPIGKPCFVSRRRAQLEPYTIVGVVKDSRYANPRGDARPMIYTTFLQTNTGRGQMVLHVRVSGSPGAVIQRIRDEVASLDPTVPIFDVHTLEEEMDAALVQPRLIALLSSLFSGLALLLACVGLYGLLAFTLVQRKSEMGIRMALGAQRADLVRLVVADAMFLVAMGLAIGVPAVIAVGRLGASQVSGLLFGLDALDPVTIVSAALGLALVAACTTAVPAWQASRVDPMLVLRTD
jgi:predicted permease